MTQAEITPAWIAVDWGTSNMRIWAMSASGTVLAEAASDQGMGKLARDGFEDALLSVIGGWLKGHAFGKQGIIGAVEILPFMVNKLAQRFSNFDN